MARPCTKQEAQELITYFEGLHRDFTNILLEAESAHSEVQAETYSFEQDTSVSREIWDVIRGTHPLEEHPKWSGIIKVFSSFLRENSVAKVVEDAERSRGTDMSICSGIGALKVLTTTVKYLFTGSAKKSEAAEAYAALNQIKDSEFPDQVSRFRDELEKIKSATFSSSDIDQELPMLRAKLKQEVENSSGSKTIDIGLSSFIDNLRRPSNDCLRYCEGLSADVEEQEKNVKKCVDLMMADSILKQMAEMEVDSLVEKGSGIRFKSLRDYGFRSVADIHTASVNSIAAVPGITAATADRLKRAVDRAGKEARKNARLQLNADEMTKAAGDVLVAVLAYQDAADFKQEGSDLRRQALRALDLTSDLQEMKGNAEWVLADVYDRKRWRADYKELKEMGDLGYVGNVREWIEKTERRRRYKESVSVTNAWLQFRRDPIIFFNLLEEIVPGLFGNGRKTSLVRSRTSSSSRKDSK